MIGVVIIITCDIPGGCTARYQCTDASLSFYTVRDAARRRGWTGDTDGGDRCPSHREVTTSG